MGRRFLAIALIFALAATAIYAVMKFIIAPSFAPVPDEDAPPATPTEIAAPVVSMPTLTRASRSIPNVGAEGRFYMSITAADTLSDIVSSLIDMRANADIAGALGVLNSLNDIIEASDEVTLFVPTGEEKTAYISFASGGGKFDAFISRAEAAKDRFLLDKWTDGTRREGEEAWTLRIVSGDVAGDKIYLTRRMVEGVSVINASTSDAAIDAMRAAMDDPPARFSPARRTDGENVIMAKMAEPTLIGGFLLGEIEASWTFEESEENGNGMRVQCFTDMFDRAPTAPPNRYFVPAKTSVFGDGELVLYASIDPAYFLYAAFPLESDPIKFALGEISGATPSILTTDVGNIIGDCRLSAAATLRENMLESAYILIDTGAEASLDRLFTLAGVFLRKGAKVDGWDTYTMPHEAGNIGFVARRGNVALLGLGEVESYAKKIDASPAAEAVSSRSNPLGLFVESGKLMSAKSPGSDKNLRDRLMEARGKMPDELANIIPAMIHIRRFSLTQSANGLTTIDISL